MPRRKADVCDLDLVLDAVRGQISVDLLCDGEVVGEVTAYDAVPETLFAPCRKALATVSRAVGKDLTPYVVFYSRIPAHLRGTGVGTALYLAAAEGASSLGGALIQHACFYSQDESDKGTSSEKGTTSPAAKAVWAGARFRGIARVSRGRVAYLYPAEYGVGEEMLAFGQMQFGEGPPRNNNPRIVQADWRENPGEYTEETIGDWHLGVVDQNGSHRFTLHNDRSGVTLTGSQPGARSEAAAAARRMIIRYETRRIGGG